MMKKILVPFLFSFGSIAWGCQCIVQSISEVISNPDIVIFKGKVIYYGQDSSAYLTMGGHPNVYLFEVIESWKNLDSTVSRLKIYDQQTSCSYKFTKDSTYLVYSYPIKGISNQIPIICTDVCSCTKLFSASKDDIKKLGASIKHCKINEYANNNPDTSFKLVLPWIISVILFCISTLLFIQLLRQSNTR